MLFLCVLAVCAYFDIKCTRIPIAALVVISVLSFVRMFATGVDVFSVLIGGSVFVVCLFLKHAVGMADIVCTLSLFLMFDVGVCVKSLLTAFLSAFIFGLVYYRGKIRDEKLPFVPFLFLGLLFSLTLG